MNSSYFEMKTFLLIYGPEKVMFYKRSSFKLKMIRKCKNEASELLLFIESYYLIRKINGKIKLIDSTNMKKV